MPVLRGVAPGLSGYSVVGGGVSVLFGGLWLAMKDARWMRPLFRHFGCSGVLGLRRPTDSGPGEAAGCGRGPFGPAGPCPAPRVGCTARGQRGGSESGTGLHRRISPSLPVRPGAGTTGARLNEAGGDRAGLGVGSIRPLFCSNEEPSP